MTNTARIDVWADWRPLRAALRVGQLQAIEARGKQTFAFEFDDDWLRTTTDIQLDPRLEHVRGPQYVPDGRANFGAFLDSSPDRWGRLLMQRREALLAREGKRPERRLRELDYLLGVFDGHRLGGLRYRVGTGPFLDDNAELASPPWASLRELEQASLALEADRADRSPHYARWLRMLIAPGRSLGGARPKASVVDPSGDLWLAKFPSANDDSDVGAWEHVVHALATKAGVVAAEGRSLKLGSRYHTFLSKRFDRSGGRRVHFASAMTLLDRTDGDAGASYLDLAQALLRHGAHTTAALEQLWRRVAFYVCVSNVDDHLRNHGFLLAARGWDLAPAYDINPVAGGGGLTLNISESDNALDLGLVRDVAEHFRVKPKRAAAIITEVRAAVATWRTEAKRLKLSRSEQDRMADAFRAAD